MTAVDLVDHVSGSGPHLVLLMGLGATHEAWEPHVRAWESSFTCHAVDNRGTGASPSAPGPWTTRDLADDVARLIRGFATEPVAVVGLSMGGAIAQELALHHPSLVSRLVLVGTWARCDPYLRLQMELVEELAHAAGKPVSAATHPGPAPDRVYQAFLQSLIWTPEHMAAQEEEILRACAQLLAVPSRTIIEQARACRAHDTAGRLGEITAPTLVTAGAADRFVPLSAAQQLDAELPDAELHLYRTGHVHHWEELDAFNDDVRTFLS